MAIPLLIEFGDLQPSASIEEVVREVARRLDPLEGWVVGVRVELCSEGTAVRTRLTLTSVPGHVEAELVARSAAPRDVAPTLVRAARQAVETLVRAEDAQDLRAAA